MAKKKKVISEKIQQLLKTVYDDCMKEDVAVRERQIRQWRRLKLLWEGFQRVWFSEIAHDWRIWDQTEDEDTDQSFYDKPINVFKAYLESIIAALSVTVPPIKCYPDDADNTLDLATARAGDKIVQLIYRHNNVALLWLHALFIFVTEGMTACYAYPKSDESYGTYEERETDDVEEEHEMTTCPNCGYTINDQVIGNQPGQQPNPNPNPNPMMPDQNMEQADEMKDFELDEFQPDDDDAELHHSLLEGQDLCPACMAMMDPEVKREKFIVTRLVGVTTIPKTRICTEVYGGLYVKVANYAKNQKMTPYLIFSDEQDYSMVVEEFEHLHGNKNLIKKIKGGSNPSGYDAYAQWGRLSPQYQGEYPFNVVTVNRAWIRPAKFNILPNKEDITALKELFPDGVKVVFVDDEYAEACNESLDDCWTLLENPLSEYLHFDPLGQGQVSIQEITNDLISLILQTIEHGIGQTFADSAVLNFKAYEQTEVTPGGIFPATPKSGKGLADSFHELKTATLSSEVMPFSQQIQTFAQLTSGALPSIFGGQLEGSETASEYSMSRAQALQRLQNTWKMFTAWWKTIHGKIVPMYIKEVKDDERYVRLGDDGNFINEFIYKADLEGKIGRVELEANENLPMTWGQKKDLVEKLLMNPNPQIAAILQSPENLGIIHEALGLVDFYVPGEDDVIKQNDEIKILLNSEPIPNPMDPMMPELPSVEIDPIYDNNAIEFETVRKWVISESGRQAKNDPKMQNGYRNVLLHGKLHFLEIQKAQQAQMMAQMQEKGAAPDKKPDGSKTKEAPITGESNVATVQ